MPAAFDGLRRPASPSNCHTPLTCLTAESHPFMASSSDDLDSAASPAGFAGLVGLVPATEFL